MKLPRPRTILLTPVILLTVAYVALAIRVATHDTSVAAMVTAPANLKMVAIFGASGTAGDGILKAAMANPEISKIHVITRRSTARIDAGIASGKVLMTAHRDYLDYSDIVEQLAEVDAVFWAIGISSIGADEETYRRIHIDFPQQFLKEWINVGTKPSASFHFISSSDISADSTAMWARVKIEAENTLSDLAKDNSLRVIAYRPDYIGPTDEEAHIGQALVYWFFAPVGAAVQAVQIGQAMIEVVIRGDQFANGDKLSNQLILRYSNAYEDRNEVRSAHIAGTVHAP